MLMEGYETSFISTVAVSCDGSFVCIAADGKLIVVNIENKTKHFVQIVGAIK